MIMNTQVSCWLESKLSENPEKGLEKVVQCLVL